MAKNWFTRLLFDWVFVLLCKMMQGLLNLVSFIESFFDIFAGTEKVIYKGSPDFLINIFFAHDAVTNAFWAMALIAIVLAFGFCIFAMARKVTDVAGAVKQSVGQILSNFMRCLLIIILLNAMSVAAINISNVMLDRINYALENAAILDREDEAKTFTDQEYAVMTKILATVANYSVNPSADSRYNINSCFNAVRNDLLALHVNGFFDYDFGMDANGHHTWQSALALLASSADLTQDLNLDTYYSDVAYAFNTVSREISTYGDFAPVKSAAVSTQSAMDTDVLIFLIAGMNAAQNGMYNDGNFDNALRRGYITGDKDYRSLDQVRKDFDIWDMDYLVAYIACIVFIIIMAICIFTFIVRMFNLLLLYLVAPLFVSSMPLDDGGKFQSWTQAFVIQLFSGFGSIIAMRLYLIIIPLVISSDLIFFPGSGFGNALMNRMAQLLMVLGGAWAVLQASALITGILAGNPGMAAIQQEGRIGGMVTHGAVQAARGAVHLPGKVVGGAKKAITAPADAVNSAKKFGSDVKEAYQSAFPTRGRNGGGSDSQAAGGPAASGGALGGPSSVPPPTQRSGQVSDARASGAGSGSGASASAPSRGGDSAREAAAAPPPRARGTGDTGMSGGGTSASASGGSRPAARGNPYTAAQYDISGRTSPFAAPDQKIARPAGADAAPKAVPLSEQFVSAEISDGPAPSRRQAPPPIPPRAPRKPEPSAPETPPPAGRSPREP